MDAAVAMLQPFGGWDVRTVHFPDERSCVLEFCDGSKEVAHQVAGSWVLETGKQVYKRREEGGRLEVLNKNEKKNWKTVFVLYDGQHTVTYTSLDKEAWRYVRIEALLRFIEYRKGKDFTTYSAMPPQYKVVAGFGPDWIRPCVERLEALGAKGNSSVVQGWAGFQDALEESPYGMIFAD